MKPLVGLIGLGNAGLSLATALLKKCDVVGYDRDAARCALARDAGVRVVDSAAGVANATDIILLSLPTPEASLAAARSLSEGALQGRLIVESSTVGPVDIDALVTFFSPHGATVMDSAIVGGVKKLTSGQTTFLVGGSQADYDRVKSILESIAEEIFFLGPTGNGMRAKLVVNAVAHTTMVMLLEAGAMCVKAGMPIELFYKLMRRESGLLRPLTHRLGERILGQDFEGGMNTANACKDSALAMQFGRAMGVPLFTLQASHSVYEMAMGEGLAGLDYASISKLWERWLDISFQGTPPKE